MIDQSIKDNIIAMFLSGAETGAVLATYSGIGKTTIYNLRNQAKSIMDSREFAPLGQPTGVIGDTHEPFCHPRYLEFVKDTFEQYGVGPVVHIGDWVDNHAMSYHESDPDGRSAGDEFEVAMEHVAMWTEAFPEGVFVSGNHDNIPKRKVLSAGLTKRVLRENLYNLPGGWISREEVIINDVHYSHGIGMSGQNGHRTQALTKGMSAVIGHVHSHGGTAYIANPYQLMFGLNVGCGVDIEAYAMAYGKYFPHRPTLGCGIVFGPEMGIFVPMNMRRYSRHN